METAEKKMSDVRPLMCGYCLEVYRFESPEDRHIFIEEYLTKMEMPCCGWDGWPEEMDGRL